MNRILTWTINIVVVLLFVVLWGWLLPFLAANLTDRYLHPDLWYLQVFAIGALFGLSAYLFGHVERAVKRIAGLRH